MNANDSPTSTKSSDLRVHRLGIDIGGVIVQKSRGRSDTSFFTDNFLKTPMMEDAFAIIGTLVDKFGPTNVFVVSKCMPPIQKKSLLWFEHHRFYGGTGVLPENVFFCETRPEKGPIAARLDLTHFIDDRADCLEYMAATVPNRYLFGPQRNPVPPDVTHVLTWVDVWGATNR